MVVDLNARGLTDSVHEIGTCRLAALAKPVVNIPESMVQYCREALGTDAVVDLPRCQYADGDVTTLLKQMATYRTRWVGGEDLMVTVRCYGAMVRQRGGKRRSSGGRIADDSFPSSTPLAEVDPYLPSPLRQLTVEDEPQSED